MRKPTLARLILIRHHFGYDPLSGVFWWRHYPAHRSDLQGRSIVTTDTKGHLRLFLSGQTYSGAMVAWFLHFGEWPGAGVDHRSRDVTDNRIENLRLASARAKAFNAKRQYDVVAQRLILPSPERIAYLAGMIDADGSVRFKRGRPFVSIYNTNRPLILWLKSLGSGHISKGNKGRAQVMAWTITAARDVHALVSAVQPHLIVKRGDANRVLDHLREKYEWAR